MLRIGLETWPVTEIALVGECTNQNGPWADDWFLVLVHRDGHWVEVSMYSEGEQLRLQLVGALSDPLQIGLADSTDFASRIMRPAAFAEHPLFVYERINDKSFLRRLRRFFVPELIARLSSDALSLVSR